MSPLPQRMHHWKTLQSVSGIMKCHNIGSTPSTDHLLCLQSTPHPRTICCVYSLPLLHPIHGSSAVSTVYPYLEFQVLFFGWLRTKHHSKIGQVVHCQKSEANIQDNDPCCCLHQSDRVTGGYLISPWEPYLFVCVIAFVWARTVQNTCIQLCTQFET